MAFFITVQELSSMALGKSPCLHPHGMTVLVVALLRSRGCQKCEYKYLGMKDAVEM